MLKPIPTPKDEPPSPRRPAQEPLRPLQPTSFHVAVEPARPKEKILESESRSPTESKKPVIPSSSPADAEPEEVESTPLEVVDLDTFNQILELDEDEDSHDFSQPMVWDYFDQAVKTFGEMDDALSEKDLTRLSALGHFLKGSSAALGLSRVQHTCEKIQHVGLLRDEIADKDLSPAEALTEMEKLLKRVNSEYIEAQAWLKDFYGDDNA